MPEAFACFSVFVVAVAAFIGAKFIALDPARRATPQEEFQRLRQQRAWLEERLQQSWRENWGDEMRAQLVDEINEVDAALARTAAELKEAA